MTKAWLTVLLLIIAVIGGWLALRELRAFDDRIECIDSSGHRYYEKRQVKVISEGAGLFAVRSRDGKIDDQVSGNCWVAKER